MSGLVPVALLGWPLVALLWFQFLTPRRAVIGAVISGWLFLPMAGFPIPGLPDYGKAQATSFGALLGVILYDAGCFTRFRVHWCDIPAFLWCIVPLASSLSNGLGFYDGASGVFTHTTTWGVPYLLGRLYFRDASGLRDLAVGVLLGGLVYLPLCVWEMRMSPRLHVDVYGFRQHTFVQAKRDGGYRPMVFMQHGLAAAFWMSSAALVAVWLWVTKTVRRIWGMPIAVPAAALVVTAVLFRSFGALALLVGGGAALLSTRVTRSKALVAFLVLGPILYMTLRGSGAWDASQLVGAARTVAGDERAGSLQYRIDAETWLIERALQQPAFGWGGWGRNRPTSEPEGGERFATDGYWVIALGQRGVVGLASLAFILLTPLVLALRRLRVGAWCSPVGGPIGVLAALPALFMIDSLFNAMLNPVYPLISGAVCAYFVSGSWGGAGSGPRRLGPPVQRQFARRPRAPA